MRTLRQWQMKCVAQLTQQKVIEPEFEPQQPDSQHLCLLSAITNSWTIHFAFLTALTWKMKEENRSDNLDQSFLLNHPQSWMSAIWIFLRKKISLFACLLQEHLWIINPKIHQFSHYFFGNMWGSKLFLVCCMPISHHKGWVPRFLNGKAVLLWRLKTMALV